MCMHKHTHAHTLQLGWDYLTSYEHWNVSKNNMSLLGQGDQEVSLFVTVASITLNRAA